MRVVTEAQSSMGGRYISNENSKTPYALLSYGVPGRKQEIVIG
jgi:hypothetical protein